MAFTALHGYYTRREKAKGFYINVNSPETTNNLIHEKFVVNS